MQDFVNGGASSLFRAGAHRVGGPGVSLPGNFWNQPRRNCRRNTAAPPPSEKNATRRRVSRIILALVVNASSRRRRGLPSTRSAEMQHEEKYVDCWSYHVGRWILNETTWKTAPKPPKSVFENRTAETEFSIFEFWGRFGSVPLLEKRYATFSPGSTHRYCFLVLLQCVT